jgi:hypothetical protein
VAADATRQAGSQRPINHNCFNSINDVFPDQSCAGIAGADR